MGVRLLSLASSQHLLTASAERPRHRQLARQVLAPGEGGGSRRMGEDCRVHGGGWDRSVRQGAFVTRSRWRAGSLRRRAGNARPPCNARNLPGQ